MEKDLKETENTGGEKAVPAEGTARAKALSSAC
jgi:hypothetical protein